MGNDTSYQVDKELAKNRQQLVKRINFFYNEVLAQDNEMVPLRHVFLRKIKLNVCIQKDRAAFFKKLGDLIKGIVKVYAGAFDPDLITDTCEFIAMVAGSSSGNMEQQRFYSVQRLKDSLIRVDIFTVAQSVKIEGTQTQTKTLVANIFALSSIKIDKLDDNETKIALLMKQYEEPKSCSQYFGTCWYNFKDKYRKNKNQCQDISQNISSTQRLLFKDQSFEIEY